MCGGGRLCGGLWIGVAMVGIVGTEYLRNKNHQVCSRRLAVVRRGPIEAAGAPYAQHGEGENYELESRDGWVQGDERGGRGRERQNPCGNKHSRDRVGGSCGIQGWRVHRGKSTTSSKRCRWGDAVERTDLKKAEGNERGGAQRVQRKKIRVGGLRRSRAAKVVRLE